MKLVSEITGKLNQIEFFRIYNFFRLSKILYVVK